MPKAATRQKTEPKAAKDAKNGKSGPLDDIIKKHQSADFVDVELAKKEYLKRRSSQLESIKRTDKKLLRSMLYQMVLGRRFEEKCAEVYRMGKIGGFCHLYIGQEAIAVGSMDTRRPRSSEPACRD